MSEQDSKNDYFDIVPITKALVSLTDKSEFEPVAETLYQNSIEIISTGGTAKAIKEMGFNVTQVSDYTGSPEIMGGRLKTIHPKVEGGLLGDWGNKKHRDEAMENGISPIEIVFCNLYNFSAVNSDTPLDEANEKIDIGGPTMIRAAAKNWKWTAVVTNPSQYFDVINEIQRYGGLTGKTRYQLRCLAFKLTALYDKMIDKYHDENPEAPPFL